MGAIVLERDGVFDETFQQTGFELNIREPKPAIAATAIRISAAEFI
jgi:hypothetical protein